MPYHKQAEISSFGPPYPTSVAREGGAGRLTRCRPGAVPNQSSHKRKMQMARILNFCRPIIRRYPGNGEAFALTILSGQSARYPGHQNLEANLRVYPSPIFVAAIIGVEKLLCIDLDATQGPVSFVRQVLDRLPERVPAFGKAIGFVINYSPDKAVRFDPKGQPIAILDRAVRPGTAVLRLGGRPIPAEALGLIFG
jgi:hypothetical protein